jgi:MFS family permease
MSSTSATPPTPPPDQKAAAFTTTQLVQAIKENFVVVSGTALIFGVVLASTFVTAYLTVFDWHLLWFVQYTDIITFGLLGLGIISGSLIILQALAQTVISLFHLKKDSRVRWTWMLGLFLVAFIIFEVWGAVHSGQGYFHIIWSAIALGLGVIVILQIIGYFISGMVPNIMQFAILIMLVVSGAGALGQWLGYSVLETEKPQDVKLKGNEMNGVKVVIVMSRHTIFLKDHDLYVVPTDDITQFHSVDLP